MRTGIDPLNTAPQTFAQRKAELRTDIEAAGLCWAAVSKVLPDWVSDAGDSKAALLELKGFLIRHFGLRMNEAGRLQPCALPQARFKTSSGTDARQVASARSSATACAKLISKVCVSDWVGIRRPADNVRDELLSRSKHGWVDLETLVDFCWAAGAPVIYLPNLPIHGRKMEGMVTFVNDHPVIVLSKKVEYPDWMLFILAHEVGHIALGHLGENEGDSIVDDTIDIEGQANDQQEKEATNYAEHLLSPNGQKFGFANSAVNAGRLAANAVDLGHKCSVSPGHIILNVAYNTTINGKRLFALGNAALKLLPEGTLNPNTAEVCRNAAQRYMRVDDLKSDSLEFLEKMGVL